MYELNNCEVCGNKTIVMSLLLKKEDNNITREKMIVGRCEKHKVTIQDLEDKNSRFDKII